MFGEKKTLNLNKFYKFNYEKYTYKQTKADNILK